MYETILVPTDGSEHAVRAAVHGAYLADLFDATVHVINVVDVQNAGGPFNAGGIDDEFVAQLEAEGEDAIDAARTAFSEQSVESAIVEGSPGEAIVEYADEHDVDLISMGTHGRTGIDRYITGSVTEHVVRHVEVPVLTVRETAASHRDEYDEIMIPTDGSGPAGVAIEHGLAIAERTDARVHAVNVINVSDLSVGTEYTMPTDLFETFRERGESVTGEIAAAARERGLDAVTEVREGFPARDLLDYAEDEGIDLIAMGTAGRTGVSRFLLGSTTERIIRHADTPVLAIKAQEQLAEDES